MRILEIDTSRAAICLDYLQVYKPLTPTTDYASERRDKALII